MRALLARIRAWFRRRQADSELSEEMAAHLDFATADHIARGLSPEEARRAARLRFGGTLQTTEAYRDRQGWPLLEHLIQDGRHAMRVLAKRPVLLLTTTLSLGLGIGAASAAFSVIDVFYFSPLPFRGADRLVWVAELTPPDFEGCPRCPFPTSAPTFRDWMSQVHSLDALAAIHSATYRWAHGDVVESLKASEVTPEFFDVLGVRPALGRGFAPADAVTGAEPVALLSDGFWRSRLGADSSILGTRLTAGSGDVTVIGILPRDFRFTDETQVWTPLILDASASRSGRMLRVIGRLRDGGTLISAGAELAALQSRLSVDYPATYRDWAVGIQSLRALFTMGRGRNRFALMALTTLVLLIGVLNVSGLLLSRAITRRPEFALKSALGASRGRLVRQLLIEGAAVGLSGAALGIVLALAMLPLASTWFSSGTTALHVAPNYRVLAFAVTVALLAGLSAGLGPAIHAARGDLTATLRQGSLRATPRAMRARDVLAAVQIAMALVLVATAGLLSRDFFQLRYLDLGYEPRGLYSTTLDGTPQQAQDLESWGEIASRARNRVASVAGVDSATLEYRSAIHPSVVRPAHSPSVDSSSVTPAVKAVDPSYFRTFGSRLLAGRAFGAADNRNGPLVAVVNRAAAARFWPAQKAVGREVFLGDSSSVGEVLSVVGVVDDAERGELIERHWPMVYRPFAQAPLYHASVFLFVRMRHPEDDPAIAAAQAAIRSTGRASGPLESEESHVTERLLPSQLNALAFDIFAGFGIFLATIGIYASVAYGVTRRAHEVGIRMALGAARWSLVATLAGRQVSLALRGVIVGLLGVLALRRVLDSFLLASGGSDPWFLVGSGCVCLGVALAATCIPAWRATRADAAMALRME